ncbi:HPr family phosphocarrier protein [Fervidobacterium thailandense]|uniref:HPr domain-containing protein n=1 Tax=Fervidobacterium thailandense TaxID=1008305 RepID=A0A1E3G152_9BACT|nr:HPr family phosphocarrier protein [Fervidobacterium thailandense]ODN29955.1 hypothetical protein A4H02_08090 [Fervidobacterium thailandense]
MRKLSFVVQKEEGFHLKPLTEIVTELKKYSASVNLRYKDKVVNIKNILAILSLGIGKGQEVEFEIDGEDEAEVEQILRERIVNI